MLYGCKCPGVQSRTMYYLVVVLTVCVCPVFLKESKNIQECCGGDALIVDLEGRGAVYGGLPGASNLHVADSAKSASMPCSKQMLMEMKFMPSHRPSCAGYPRCDRSILQVDLYYKQFAQETTLHIGGNEWGKHEGYGFAEIQGIYDTFIYKPTYKTGEDCKNEDNLFIEKMMPWNVNRVSLFIAHEYVRIENDLRANVTSCNECGLKLDGQEGSNKLYIAINRRLDNNDIPGNGVCKVVLSWACSLNY